MKNNREIRNDDKHRRKLPKKVIVLIASMCLFFVITVVGILLLAINKSYLVGGILTGIGVAPILVIGVYMYLKYC